MSAALLKASKMRPWRFLSAKLAKTCASDATTAMVGATLCWAAVRLMIGRHSTAMRKVPMTLMATLLSQPPSHSTKAPMATPALRTSESSLGSSRSTLAQKSRTLDPLDMSTCHTSTARRTPAALGGRLLRVETSMSARATSPLAVSRHAKITLAAPSRAKYRAASRPSPLLPPVTITVLPVKSDLGSGNVLSWFLMKFVTKLGPLGRRLPLSTKPYATHIDK
ncbi:hypothetical protein PoMZ_06478 [Pyricularia oryzae]|uniref:Uncharacterized protein n=1 Tax=Pyricularia oryzae TaxID=318829 RepID=A0A4P7NQX8_PYROR|nr:hypothetical protein PoMZ_06478 [Pyricularia oryzae]